jgi:glycerate 2-kinase
MKVTNAKEALLEIFQAGVLGADPSLAVKRNTEYVKKTFLKGKHKKVIVAGFGKASVAMAKAAEEELGEWIKEGIVITKYGHAREKLKKTDVFEAGHPVPDENGVKATEKILHLIEKEKGPDTLLLTLISGGGSALFVSPCEGITLPEKQKTTDLLLGSGADINEINTVRKHLSRVKGGRLAELASPTGMTAFILSDVIGDRLDVIASGPTVPDPTTYSDALSVLKKYHLMGKIPVDILALLKEGAKGNLPETPKEEREGVRNIIIGNNRMALEAAREKAIKMGFEAEITSSEIKGDARDRGKELAIKGKNLKETKRNRPLCLISGGETTVTLKGKGRGGRNTELALAFAIEMAGTKGIMILSAATDGTDGPTDAAGAIVDRESTVKGKEKGLEAEEYLTRNDSYTYFERTGDILKTGPTGTNVMDMQILLIE